MINAIRSLLGTENVMLCCTPMSVPYTERADYYEGIDDIDGAAAHAADLREANGNPVVLALHQSVVYLQRPNITLGLFTSTDACIPPIAVAVAGQGITHTSLHLVSAKVDEAAKDATWFEAACLDYAVRVTENRGRVEWFVPLAADEGITTQA